MAARIRSPRYGRFLLTGALLGLLVAFVVAQLAPATSQYTRTDVFRYLGFLAMLVGGLLGGVVAVLLDRGSGSGTRSGTGSGTGTAEQQGRRGT